MIGKNNASQALFALHSLMGFGCVFYRIDSIDDRSNFPSSIISFKVVSSVVSPANAKPADLLVNTLVTNERAMTDTRGLAVKQRPFDDKVCIFCEYGLLATIFRITS